MIHYHGTPITPEADAARILRCRHAMVSFANPEQLPLVAEVCSSFAIDNGAFSIWRSGQGTIDVPAYLRFINEWRRHPGFDWCLLPDVIDGDESANDALIEKFGNHFPSAQCVPIWHLHESLERLGALISQWPRVAIGSSGRFAQLKTADWWSRMDEAFESICINGRPVCKVHGLRMLDPEIIHAYPLSSGDSTNVAQNIGIDGKWRGRYQPPNKATRGIVLADRIESAQSPATWDGRMQHELEFEVSQ